VVFPTPPFCQRGSRNVRVRTIDEFFADISHIDRQNKSRSGSPLAVRALFQEKCSIMRRWRTGATCAATPVQFDAIAGGS
jgi:hypothetical protein